MEPEINVQCWICPKCHDDHAQAAPCTPKSNKSFMPSPDDKSYIAEQYRNLVDLLDSERQRIAKHETKITLLETALKLATSAADLAIDQLSAMASPKEGA